MTSRAGLPQPVAAVAGRTLRRASPRGLMTVLVSAVLTAAASRPWGLGLLALVAYVPAFDAIATARTARSGALLAALTSLGLASVAYEATVAIGPHIYLLTLLLAPIPFAAVGAVAVRLRLVAGRLGLGRYAVVALLPVLWCAAEWLPAQPRLLGSYALPLGAIGYSQVQLPTAQLASLSSVTAVSAAVLLTNALLLIALRATSTLTRLVALTALAGLGLTVALHYGAFAGGVDAGRGNASSESTDDAAVLVRLVQPNLPDSAYLAAAYLPGARMALIAALEALATDADRDTQAGPPALTILPEAAWPGPLLVPQDGAALDASQLHATGFPTPLLFGAPSTGRTAVVFTAGGGDSPGESPRGTAPGAPTGAPVGAPAGSLPPQGNSAWFANSAFLLSDGHLALVQDKIHLVPIAEAGLRPGTGPAVSVLGDLRLSTLICYDVVFPHTSRVAVLAGAELLTVITDDSFAAEGDVPKLHVRLAVFRAIENGVPVALASNTGPSALIDSTGRIVARSPPLLATALTAELPLQRRHTTYSVHGDWLGVVALVVALASSAVAAVRGGGAGSFGSRPT